VSAAGTPRPAGGAPDAPPPRAHSLAGHLRAATGFIVLMVLVGGFAYPAIVTGIAHVIDPAAAGGSLIRYPNGTVEGSSQLAQNLSAGTLGPSLFWARPSLTDYNTTLGADSPPGPTDPALQALLNETIEYMELTGNFTVNATLPFWWVAPSASSLDPDLVPQAVLVQIPRVAANNNYTVLGSSLDARISFLQTFVNEHITQPVLPDVGVAYVNVLELDIALLEVTGNPTW
jgi:potassium-transporting ATPase KdpC subunit